MLKIPEKVNDLTSKTYEGLFQGLIERNNLGIGSDSKPTEEEILDQYTLYTPKYLPAQSWQQKHCRSCVFIINFEHVIAGWVLTFRCKLDNNLGFCWFAYNISNNKTLKMKKELFLFVLLSLLH